MDIWFRSVELSYRTLKDICGIIGIAMMIYGLYLLLFS